MRTKVILEPSDIKFSTKEDPKGGDPVHNFLMVQLLVAFVMGPGKYNPDDPLATMRVHVSQFLNGAAEAGISITKSELPKEFTDAFTAGTES